MSRCVSVVYRRVSETKHLYRDSDTCHRDRSTVQRDTRLCHRDRLSPRPETNRNFTMAVLYVRLYVHPSAPFQMDNLSICSWNFFKFCIHIVIGDEWYGIVDGQNLSILNSYCPCSYWKNSFLHFVPLVFMISQ